MSSLAKSPMAEPAVRRASRRMPAHNADALLQPLEKSVERRTAHLLHLQKTDGHWCGELQGDTILESEYIMLMAYLGRDGDGRLQKAAHYIVQQERPEGAWSNYPGGPVDISVSVKAYFALKLCGYDAEHPVLCRA